MSEDSLPNRSQSLPNSGQGLGSSIVFLSNIDSDLLTLRIVAEGVEGGFPPIEMRKVEGDFPAFNPPNGGIVILRLLGGESSWQKGLLDLRRRCIDLHAHLLVFNGEAVMDTSLAAISTVERSLYEQAFNYIAQGGRENVENLLRYLLAELVGLPLQYKSPIAVPAFGLYGEVSRHEDRPMAVVLFYRAHYLSGNTWFVDELKEALVARGLDVACVYCYSLRPLKESLLSSEDLPSSEESNVTVVDLLASLSPAVVVTTVLTAAKFEEEETFEDTASLGRLGVPVVQALVVTDSFRAWERSSNGLSPLDVVMAVALPELDGRIISVPVAFKEVVDISDPGGVGVTAYRSLPDRLRALAGLVARLATLSRKHPSERRVAIVLSAYPTKRSRIGNAVGLDTPASIMAVLDALDEAGYRLDRKPKSGDALMAELAAGLCYDKDSLSPEQAERVAGRWSGEEYTEKAFARMPSSVQSKLQLRWGPPPGDVYVDQSSEEPFGNFYAADAPAYDQGAASRKELLFPGIDLGGVLIAVQPPRGFGEDPIAIYHAQDLDPPHHYIAFYRWLDSVWKADVLIHLGKHGSLEWLPGKAVGLSSSCYPDIALGEMPLVYPFIVNDPGEGTQAKRRAHAVIVDHLIPPLTRAGSYGQLQVLEDLLDAHAHYQVMDPSKLPLIRQQIRESIVASHILSDLGIEVDDARGRSGKALPSIEESAFDELISTVDGYICELKDQTIRGGLHVLGRAPTGDAQIDLLAAMGRSRLGGKPSLREVIAQRIGIALEQAGRAELDRLEEACREQLVQLQKEGWVYQGDDETLAFICNVVVPALNQTPEELTNLLRAVGGQFVPPGPSGSPSRGMAHVLPTGRNFYSVDPRSIPTKFAFEVGSRLANELVARYLDEEGRFPRSVGLVMWGTSAMRTGGDDIAEALALMGVSPVWSESSGRVEGLQLIDLAELGRPRIDVTLRISGFFRDAFPHVVDLLNEAAALVLSVEEDDEHNFVRASRYAGPRVFGPKAGAYGSGLLPVIDAGKWGTSDDLAQVFLEWSSYGYTSSQEVLPAAEELRSRLMSTDVATKNQDNREHDIFDSDDYFQEHGGLIAAVRALSGRQPKAYFGDSSNPSKPIVRPLTEEAARVIRARALNPKWIAAMMRHGYKGAFEISATVDYFFGYDATALVASPWMYEGMAHAYLDDPAVREFFKHSNPWALKAIAERLLEAVTRGMWNASPDRVAMLKDTVLEVEGWEES